MKKFLEKLKKFLRSFKEDLKKEKCLICCEHYKHIREDKKENVENI